MKQDRYNNTRINMRRKSNSSTISPVNSSTYSPSRRRHGGPPEPVTNFMNGTTREKRN